MGIPYLWGGTSAKAFDCSGFVKRVYELEGIVLPRDSDLQSLVGTMIPYARVGEARPGDLFFFGEGDSVKHVAIHLGEGHFIHAYGLVRRNSLRISDSDYDAKLARSLLFGRSVFSGEDVR
jgi:cell wall-associated NlpC family hydrolase